MSDDIEFTGLNPNEYNILVAPAMQVVTEIAAKRGDPQCFNDIPSMVALLSLTTTLANCYWNEWGELGEASSEEAVAAAPISACVMVLQNAELAQHQINDMALGLANGYQQLLIDNVIGQEIEITEQAWRLITHDKHDDAKEQLKHAAMAVIIAVETWEERRNSVTATKVH